MSKKVLIIEIQEIEYPKGGFLEAGWYGGRQYYKKQFGRQGRIIVDSDDEYTVKKRNIQSKIKLCNAIMSKKIYTDYE